MKRSVILLIVFLCAIAAGAQSNAFLDQYLEAEVASCDDTLLLIAQASGFLTADANPDQGYQWALEQSFGKTLRRFAPEDPIPLGLFYLAVFETFEIKGGLMYSLFGGPRYAAFEAVHRGYVPSSTAYPTRSLKPYEVLTALSTVMDDVNPQEAVQ